MTHGGEQNQESDQSAKGIERFIERERQSLEGNPTEYARGFEGCLDRLEKFVEQEMTQPQLSEAEARTLLSYTKSMLGADDNYDETREQISRVCDELENVLDNNRGEVDT